MRPHLLDLFCGAGGAGMGYHLAGFDVFGVDIEPHPDYPFSLAIANAMEVVTDPYTLRTFDVIHASPPCPRYSTVTPHGARDSHPDLVSDVREALQAAGANYVIENVPGAPLLDPVRLCGSSFGLGVRRHRLFESSIPIKGSGCDHAAQGQPFGVYGQHGDLNGAVGRRGGGSRGVKARDAAHAREVMGIDWMTKWADLADAIPPAYTEFIGAQLIDHLRAAA